MTVVPDKVEQKLGLKSFKSVTSFSKRQVGKEIPFAEKSDSNDKQIEKELQQFLDKKRQSLLTIHQEKLKKKRLEGNTEKKDRKPLDFDPEKDHVRNFDERQTKSVTEKSKLNTQFSSGSCFCNKDYFNSLLVVHSFPKITNGSG